jgi:hypothetical protein
LFCLFLRNKKLFNSRQRFKQSLSHRRRLLPRLIHPHLIIKSALAIAFRLSGRMRDGGYLSFSNERAEFHSTQPPRLQAANVFWSYNEQN